MKIRFLGTGTSQGIPVIGCNCQICQSQDPQNTRTRSSVYIELNQKKILIDVGPDLRQQFLRHQLDDIDFALITHEHNDHIAGLDELRSINFKWNKDIPILTFERVIESLTKRFDYIFSENPYPGLPRIYFHKIENQLFKYQDVEIIPIKLMHGRIPILGYRISDFVYLTDVKTIEASELKKIEGVKTLVINALRKEKHSSHLNLEEALEIIVKVNPQNAYLTHISHLMGNPVDISKDLPQNVYLAYDGLTIEV